MRTIPMNTVERMISTARAAARCRLATHETSNQEVRDALFRCADRYSRQIADLAQEMLSGGDA